MFPGCIIGRQIQKLTNLVVLIGLLIAPIFESHPGRYFLFSEGGLLLHQASDTEAEILIKSGSIWKYTDSPDSLDHVWTSNDYRDNYWRTGPAEFGYGDGDESTVLGPGLDANRKNITTYFRHYFFVPESNSYSGLLLELLREDGAVIYINGEEVLRSNMPEGIISQSTLALRRDQQVIEVEIDPAFLIKGINVIAVEVHLSSPVSTSKSFDLALWGIQALPPVQPTPTPTTAPPTPTPAIGREFFVSPQGSPQGDGSIGDPWDIDTAFETPAVVQPGDTIWLREGVYGEGGEQVYEIRLEGEKDEPVTIRAYPGERATIDGSLRVEGDWSVIWGLEIMNSDPKRLSIQASSNPSDISRQGGIQSSASNTKFINNIIHDTRSGFGLWKEAQNTETYGNLVYNNGFVGLDRGHGHGIYTQNETGTKRFLNNIIFNNFSRYGVHIYSEEASIDGYYLEGNVVVNDEFLIGGLQPANRITLIGNHVYGGKTRLGYRAENNGDVTLRNNFFGAFAGTSLELKWWREVVLTGNTIWNSDHRLIDLVYPEETGSYFWNFNNFTSRTGTPFSLNESPLNWNDWLDSTHFDQDSSYTNSTNSETSIFVYPNQYEKGRANIVIYNWQGSDTALVDISRLGLQIGAKYTLHNAMNYYDEQFAGVYMGEMIEVPMNGLSTAKPVGWESALHADTSPQFGVFVLTVD